MSQLVVAAAVLDNLARPSLLLAARRSYPRTLAGRWELPGGKVELNETPAGALHRELDEELGLAVSLGPLVPGPLDGDWPIPSGRRLRVFLAAAHQGSHPVPGSDHDAVRWLSADLLFEPAWLDGDLAVIGALAPLLGGSGGGPRVAGVNLP